MLCRQSERQWEAFWGLSHRFLQRTLEATAIRGALESGGVAPEAVQEVFMGNVLQAGLGQAPARQAAMKGGIPQDVPCTTVNKVCASGMKSIALAVQAIASGDIDVAVAGGMENMSQVPHYFLGRNGNKFGGHEDAGWHVT